MGEYHDKFLRLTTMILGHFRHIRIFSNSNIWNRFVDLFIRLFWGFKHGSSKKKWLQGLTINNDLCEKLYGVKTMGLLECQHTTSSPGRKQTWFSVVHSFQVFKYVGIFWLWFLLDTSCISKEDFLSNAGICFGGVVVAIDTVLRSLKGKILLRIKKLVV